MTDWIDERPCPGVFRRSEVKTNIANSHQFLSGSGFSFTLNADPEPTFHFDADPDPVPSKKMQMCDHWYTDPPRLHFVPFTPPLLHFESPQLLNLDSYADSDSDFHSNVITDQTSQKMRIHAYPYS